MNSCEHMDGLDADLSSAGETILRLEAAVRAELENQEPVGYQYQDRDGKWQPFVDEEHYDNTVKDGTWPVRAIYAAPVVQPEVCKEKKI